ncbi:MAG: hypothetical protein ACI3XI_07255 [Eubacteriales bacterium]
MDFETNNRLFTAYDGRILLRTGIGRPVNNVGMRFEYIRTLSAACERFAAEELFLKLSEAYRNEAGRGGRFVPYSYSVKIQNTYSDEEYLSLLIIATIRRGSDILSGECRSVIFKNDSILPQKFISKSHKKDVCLVLDADGIPSWATFDSPRVRFERAEKYRFPI